MKKIIVLLLTIFVLTGCTYEYNLKISNKTISENAYVLNYDKDTWNTEFKSLFNMTYKEYVTNVLSIYEPVYFETDLTSYTEKYDGIDYYETTLINKDSVYGLNYKYNHSFEKYKDSRMFKACYDKVEFKDENNKINIETSSSFNCFYQYELLDEVVINVTTDWNYKIVSSNADKEEDGKYTWIITKENASNKPITIELKRVFNWRLALIIGIPTLLVITAIYFVLKNKLVKKDQI